MLRLRTQRIILAGASFMICVAAIIVLLSGILIGSWQYLTGGIVALQLSYRVKLANSGLPSDVPSTVKPVQIEFEQHRVAPDEPRYIFIPNLSVRAMVKPMRLTADNRIQAPINVHHAGWYTKSAKPGKPGVVLIDGHVSNWGAVSIFHDLKKLSRGDRITIQRGDDTELTYTVTKSQTYDLSAVDMGAVLSPINPQKPGLNLITCAGRVIKGNEYEKRLVVFAEQLSP